MKNSLEDYRALFALDEAMLTQPIVVYPAGIASFGAKMYESGHPQVVSIDPYYDLSPMDMMKHVNFVIQNLTDTLSDTNSCDVMNHWTACAQAFLADYSVGQKEGRYILEVLPTLPYKDGAFALGLCPYLYFRQGQSAYHKMIMELCRIALEVRVCPLMNNQGEVARELGAVMLALQQMNLGVEVQAVFDPFSQKSNAMLRIWSKECVVV